MPGGTVHGCPPTFGARRPMRPRVVLAVWLAAVLGLVALVFPPTRGALANVGARTRTAVGASAAAPAGGRGLRLGVQAAPPAPTLRVPAAGVRIPDGYRLLGWAMPAGTSGEISSGSTNAATMTNYTESMIKPWLAADYLSRTVKAGRKPSQQDLTQLRSMIIHSDDRIASHYYNLGGKDAV